MAFNPLPPTLRNVNDRRPRIGLDTFFDQQAGVAPPPPTPVNPLTGAPVPKRPVSTVDRVIADSTGRPNAAQNTSKNPAYTLQRQLAALGYDVGTPDGIIGSKTTAAIKAFQRANGLVPDGIAGPKTIAALNGGAAKPAGAVNSPSGGHSPGSSGGGGAGSPAPSVTSPSVNPPKYSSEQIRTNSQDLLKNFQSNAALQVDAQLNPQINSLQRAMELLDAQYQRQRGETSQRKNIATGDLTALFDRTTNYLGNLQNTQDAQYAQGGVDVSGLYDQLRQTISGNFDRAQQQTNNEAARLGLQEATGAGTSAMNSDEAWLRNMANSNQANSLNNLGAMRQGFDDLMSFQRGNAQQEKATRVSQSQRDYDKQLNELMNNYNDQTYDLSGKRRDIENTRGAKIQEIIDALTANHEERSRLDEQSAFERWLAEQGLAQDNAKFEYQQQYDYDKMLMEGQLAQLGNQPKAEKPSYKGGAGALQYIKDTGASPTVQQVFNDFLGSPYNEGSFAKVMDDVIPQGAPGNRHFNVELARRLPNPADRALFLDLINILYGTSY